MVFAAPETPSCAWDAIGHASETTISTIRCAARIQHLPEFPRASRKPLVLLPSCDGRALHMVGSTRLRVSTSCASLMPCTAHDERRDGSNSGSRARGDAFGPLSIMTSFSMMRELPMRISATLKTAGPNTKGHVAVAFLAV